jgi:hypothetical protein
VLDRNLVNLVVFMPLTQGGWCVYKKIFLHCINYPIIMYKLLIIHGVYVPNNHLCCCLIYIWYLSIYLCN